MIVKDVLDDDIDLLDERLAAFQEALTRPCTVQNVLVAVEALARAAAPFGRLRQQLNRAVVQPGGPRSNAR